MSSVAPIEVDHPSSVSKVIPDFRGVLHLEDIQNRFFASAKSIMLQHELMFREERFEITALELYLKLHQNPDIWFDRATDRDENANEQFNRATWYVRQKKGPAYWRIDITAGDMGERIQAGLLIRQLDGVGGPAKALHRIARGKFGRHSWMPDELDLIAQIHGKRIDGSDNCPLRLVRRPTPISKRLSKGRRINLPRNDDQNVHGCSIRAAPLRVAICR